MTNVPDDLRQLWREIYTVFDKNYLMDTSKQESWNKYWDDATEVLKKYPEVPCVIDIFGTMSEMIGKLAAGRKNSE